MMAMQYSIVLPSDYDMSVIRERIATKGPLTDDFPGLAFKAFLHASRGVHGPENLYAPFYLWDDAKCMNRFLTGAGFAALTRSFGWPSVTLWSVLHGERTPHVRAARHATKSMAVIAPHADLSTWQAQEAQRARNAVVQDGALASVVAYEPGTWTLVRFQLWQDEPPAADGVQRYDVGHVSAPGTCR